MTNTKVFPHKRKDARKEIVRVVLHSVKDGYIRVTVKSLTMSGSTGRVVSVMCRQELSAVMQIVFASLRGK